MDAHLYCLDVLENWGQLIFVLGVIISMHGLVSWCIYQRKGRLPLQRRYISSPFHQLTLDFKDFAEELSPSQEYIKEGKAVANYIFKTLTQESGKHDLKIGKCLIAGSVGKGTGIMHRGIGGHATAPDLDLVVFVNDELPPFLNVFRKFQSILEGATNINYVYVRRFSVEMSVASETQGDIKVDLLAAPNRVKNVTLWGNQDVGEVEAQLTLLDLECGEDEEDILQKSKLLSSCFAVKSVETIAAYVKDPFVLNVVKLAKFWNSCVKLPSRLAPAKSCMIELLAIYCQQGGKKRNKERCTVCGFRRFLQVMTNLPKLNISLTKERDGNNAASRFESERDTLPIVREPVNPLNNLADRLHPLVIRELVVQAEQTLQILEQFQEKEHYFRGNDPIKTIFSYKE